MFIFPATIFREAQSALSMSFKALTIKDIARQLNLSPSTVSKALHNSHEISLETRTLVLEFAARHNYKPNPIAQSLKQGYSKSIGVLVCHIDNHFFSQAINGIESIAHDQNYNVIITQSHDSSEREFLNIRHLTTGSVDGLVVSLSVGSQNIRHLQELQQNGFPIVFFDRITDKINTHTITANNFQGAYDATKHLIKQGYKRIAHITSASCLSNTRERVSGYKDALREAGFEPDEAMIKYCDQGGMILGEVTAALESLLQGKNKPDAIFVGADRLSLIMVNLLRKMKIKIPQQIGLAGFTNSMSAEIFNPPLTAVTQPALEMGQLATKMLISLIESKEPSPVFENRILKTRLEIRESSLRTGTSEISPTVASLLG